MKLRFLYPFLVFVTMLFYVGFEINSTFYFLGLIGVAGLSGYGVGRLDGWRTQTKAMTELMTSFQNHLKVLRSENPGQLKITSSESPVLSPVYRKNYVVGSHDWKQDIPIEAVKPESVTTAGDAPVNVVQAAQMIEAEKVKAEKLKIKQRNSRFVMLDASKLESVEFSGIPGELAESDETVPALKLYESSR